MLGENKAQMPEPGPGGDRRPELLRGERSIGERLSGGNPEKLPVPGRHAVEALPAGQLPHPTGRHQGQVGAPVLGGQQMDGAAHHPRLDEVPLGQRPGYLARLRPLSSEADRQLGRRGDLGLDGAQAAHDAGDGFGADRIEKVLPHAPGEGLRPTERLHARPPALAHPGAQRVAPGGTAAAHATLATIMAVDTEVALAIVVGTMASIAPAGLGDHRVHRQDGRPVTGIHLTVQQRGVASSSTRRG